MTYSLQQVVLPFNHTGMIKAPSGFPSTPFNHILFSWWICLGNDTKPRSVGMGNPVAFMSVGCNKNSIQVLLLGGLSVPLFNGTFSAPVGVLLSNIIISADPTTQTLQIYLNDLPVTTLTGGVGWQGTGPFHVPSSPGFSSWDLGGTGSAAPGPGLGDLFVGNPVSFFDLTVASNRRKFINADLTPVDLGTDASSVYGLSPPIYLTVRPAGVPDDFATNNGTGGAFTIAIPPLVFEAADFCITPTPDDHTYLKMDNVIVTSLLAQSPCTTALLPATPNPAWGLRWSDTRGATWGNPVGQDFSTDPYNQPQWNRLGYARDRVFELFWSASYKTAVNGAFVDVMPLKT